MLPPSFFLCLRFVIQHERYKPPNTQNPGPQSWPHRGSGSHKERKFSRDSRAPADPPGQGLGSCVHHAAWELRKFKTLWLQQITFLEFGLYLRAQKGNRTRTAVPVNLGATRLRGTGTGNTPAVEILHHFLSTIIPNLRHVIFTFVKSKDQADPYSSSQTGFASALKH